MEVVLLVEDHGVLQQRGGLPDVLDGDGDGDGTGHTFSLKEDVLLAVGPQQVWSQQDEPRLQ